MIEEKPEDLSRIIDTMRDLIREYAARDGLILSCGPTPFMRTVQRFALEFGARAQVSLENRMACGVGACLGCVTKDGEGITFRCVRAGRCSGPTKWSFRGLGNGYECFFRWAGPQKSGYDRIRHFRLRDGVCPLW